MNCLFHGIASTWNTLVNYILSPFKIVYNFFAKCTTVVVDTVNEVAKFYQERDTMDIVYRGWESVRTKLQQIYQDLVMWYQSWEGFTEILARWASFFWRALCFPFQWINTSFWNTLDWITTSYNNWEGITELSYRITQYVQKTLRRLWEKTATTISDLLQKLKEFAWFLVSLPRRIVDAIHQCLTSLVQFVVNTAKTIEKYLLFISQSRLTVQNS
jgi:hypothetical protein